MGWMELASLLAGCWEPGQSPPAFGAHLTHRCCILPAGPLDNRVLDRGGKAEPGRGLVFPSSQQGAREEPSVLNRVWKRLRSPSWEGVAVRMRGAGAGSAAACVAGTHDLAQPSFLPAADSPPAPGGARGDGGEMRLLLSLRLLEELPLAQPPPVLSPSQWHGAAAALLSAKPPISPRGDGGRAAVPLGHLQLGAAPAAQMPPP